MMFKAKIGWGTWGWINPLSLLLLIFTQDMISASWDGSPCQAQRCVQNLACPSPCDPLPACSLSLSLSLSLSFKWIHKIFSKHTDTKRKCIAIYTSFRDLSGPRSSVPRGLNFTDSWKERAQTWLRGEAPPHSLHRPHVQVSLCPAL